MGRQRGKIASSYGELMISAWSKILLLLCTAITAVAASAADKDWYYQAYVDAGYAASNREPSDNVWRSKGTTNILNKPELFLAMAEVRKVATTDSRWGLEFGLQGGEDAKNQVPAPEKEPPSNADHWRHLYRGNVSYLAGDDGELAFTAGVFNSHIGYESYLAIENPNYTRAYILDYVPYFMTGVEVGWEISETTDLAFYVISGYDYLADINDAPSISFRGDWQFTPEFTFSQSFYYGPDQKNTNIEYWRFFTDSIAEWKHGRWLVAGAFDYGTEKQADIMGQPRYTWAGGAVWLRYAVNDKASLALRPEFYDDPDGLQTTARQTIKAITGTYKHEIPLRNARMIGTIELRYDKSTGKEGGFFDEPNDRLVPTQTTLLFGLLYLWGH